MIYFLQSLINTLNAFTSGILDYDINDYCTTFTIFLHPNPLVKELKSEFTFRPYSDEKQEKIINKIVHTDWNVIYQINSTDEMLS